MDQRKLFNQEFIALLVTTVFAAFTHVIFATILPLVIIDMGSTNTVVGYMSTAMVISGIATRIIAGKTVDTYGRKAIIQLGSLLYAINTILYCFQPTIPMLYILRIFNGISQGFYFSAAASIVADVVPENRLIEAIGYFSMMGPLSFAVAPSIALSIYTAYGSSILFYTAALTSILGFISTLFIIHPYKSEIIQTEKRSIKTFVEPLVFFPAFIYAMMQLSNSSINNFIVSMGKTRNINSVTLFFLFHTIATIIIKFLLPTLLKKYKKKTLLIASFTSMTIGFIVIAISHSLLPLILSSLLIGSALGIITPLIQTQLFQLAPIHRRGVANSTFGIFSDIGMGIGAMSFGYTIDTLGYTTTYLIAASLIILIIIKIHYNSSFSAQ